MEELIFFAIIILFSVAESIARSRRAKARKERGEEAASEQFEWAQTPPREAELPTYDEEPSYDDEPSYDERVEEPTRSPSADPQSAADVWAEIAGLATGAKQKREPEAATRPAPRQSPRLPRTSIPYEPTPSRVEAVRSRRPARLTTRHLPSEHSIHLAHAGYGTDPSERAPSEQDGLDPLAERRNRTSAAVLARLRSKTPAELRQAIVLQEVLGPPAALRGDPSA